MPESSVESEKNPSQRFFRYFQLEATALQQQMGRLEDLPSIGGERVDAIDHCLAGIARLQREVQDAASYNTLYDQRIYSEGIKALREKLDTLRAALAPKSKFSFKSVKKNESAISLSDAAELAIKQRAGLFAPPADQRLSGASSTVLTPVEGTTPPNELVSRPSEPLRRDSLGKFLQVAGVNTSQSQSARSGSATKRILTSSSNVLAVDSYSDTHCVLLDSTPDTISSNSLTNLRHCIVNLQNVDPMAQRSAGLTIKDVGQSLLICANVDGAAHVTKVENSVILVTARQFRMHDCKNCIVYLFANSQPIIERCERIRFAPLPNEIFHPAEKNSSNNEWNQVKDFNWLKAEHSPNWSILSEEERVPATTWHSIIQGGQKWAFEDILQKAGVTSLSL